MKISEFREKQISDSFALMQTRFCIIEETIHRELLREKPKKYAERLEKLLQYRRIHTALGYLQIPNSLVGMFLALATLMRRGDMFTMHELEEYLCGADIVCDAKIALKQLAHFYSVMEPIGATLQDADDLKPLWEYYGNLENIRKTLSRELQSFSGTLDSEPDGKKPTERTKDENTTRFYRGLSLDDNTHGSIAHLIWRDMPNSPLLRIRGVE